MGKKYHFDMPRDRAIQLDAYIEKRNPNNTSQVLREIIIEKLDRVHEEPTRASLIQQAKKTHPFLEETFKCRETGDTVKVKELPCVTDADLQCRNERCQSYIKNRLGLS